MAAPVVAVAGALVASPVAHVLASGAPLPHLTATTAKKRMPSPSMVYSRTSEDGVRGTALGISAHRSAEAAARHRREAAMRLARRHDHKHTAKPTTGTGSSPAPTTLTCSNSSSYLPANVQAIVSFLVLHGYSDLAAAGIAGNMYQESKGDPESVGMGGGGLIGFTPLPAGYVTGNPAVDLQTQLNAVLTYNQQWSQYIPALNAATTATEAADIYMNDFERPNAAAAAAYNREGAANAVAQACGIAA
jgi:Phage tail lysozyme